MRTSSIFVLALSLTLTLSRVFCLDAVPGFAQGTQSPTAQTASTVTHKEGSVAANSPHYGEQKGDLPNFHEVHPFLYRGGEPTEAGMKKLKEMGIKTIIDLRGNPEKVYDESKLAHKLGMRSINLPMSSKAPTKEQVEVFLETVEQAQKDPSSGSVMVHCAHGSDRTGCMVGIWRVTHEGWTYDEAYKEMRKYWFTPKFTNLSGSVQKYAAESHSEASK